MTQPQDHNLAGKISFSWEKKPGVSKQTTNQGEDLIPREHDFLPKLPPPPCTVEAATTRNLVQDFQIPLPPCAFQPPYYRISSKKGLWVQDDDPFLAAYKECTKNQRNDAKMNRKMTKVGAESKSRKGLISFFSCKRSSTVCDNSLVRINMEKD